MISKSIGRLERSEVFSIDRIMVTKRGFITALLVYFVLCYEVFCVPRNAYSALVECEHHVHLELVVISEIHLKDLAVLSFVQQSPVLFRTVL